MRATRSSTAAPVLSTEALYSTKLHWIIFVRPVCLLLFALFVSVRTPAAGTTTLLVVASFLGGSTLLLGATFMSYVTSRFVLRRHWLLIRLGWIRTARSELSLAKTEGIHVYQTLFGRLLGFGTITILGTGGSRSSFRKIARPLEFQRKLQQYAEVAQIEQRRHSVPVPA